MRLIESRPGGGIPGKVEAALEYLRFAQSVRTGPEYPEPHKEGSGRALSQLEARAYDAALSTLLEYFNTDGFGDMGPNPDGPPETPEQPKPHPVTP